MGRRRLDLKEAAETLGVTSEAIRKRAKRGTLPSETGEDGRLYVWVDDGSPTGGTVPDTDKDAHIASLEDQVSFLRAELVTRNEELRRKDHILAALTERIPELEPAAPPEARESPTEASEKPGGVEDRGEEKRRSWWRRMFGG